VILLEQGSWTGWPPEVPSNLNHSVIHLATQHLKASPLSAAGATAKSRPRVEMGQQALPGGSQRPG